MITHPGSVFALLTFDGEHDWDRLLQLAQPELDKRGLERLRTLLEAKCQAVLIERHYIDKDYRDTFSHFHSKRFNTPSSRCVRLHFFASAVTEEAIIANDPLVQASYQGYSIIRPTKPNCIGRTLLSHVLRLEEKAHLSKCEEKVLLLGTRLKVEGFPFISQDSDATVCAQSALWMVLRYYSNRYSWYPEILPFQITSLANHHATGSRVYPSSGLYSWQLAEALRLQRFSPVVYSRQQCKAYNLNFEHLLYTYIESGLPLLITMEDHVIAGYGHSSDYTRQWPAFPDRYAYSSYFNRAFVVSDDGKFPYQMLQDGKPAQLHDSGYQWKDIQEFIVPLPEKVFLAADQAQKVIEILLKGPQAGLAAHSPVLGGKRLMLRLFLTSSSSFKRHLHERGMGHQLVETSYRNLPMPHFIWVCELADFDEYARERKVLGEILWDATRNAHELNGWIAAHYPEKLLINSNSAFNQPFDRSEDLLNVELKGAVSYSLFKSNLHSL